MAAYQILYWRDIPAQVRAFEGRKPVSRTMPDRFQHSIDQVAMDEGLEGSQDYLDQWNWTEKRERPGTAEEVVDALIPELEQEYDRTRNQQ